MHILDLAMGGFTAIRGSIDGLIRPFESLMAAILKKTRWLGLCQKYKSVDVE